YASFLVAASVLARVGDAQLGAHQIAYQFFILLALILDAVAIAGQVIVGRMLGAGEAEGAYAAAVRMIGWSVVIGLVFALVLAPVGRGRLDLNCADGRPGRAAHPPRRLGFLRHPLVARPPARHRASGQGLLGLRPARDRVRPARRAQPRRARRDLPLDGADPV